MDAVIYLFQTLKVFDHIVSVHIDAALGFPLNVPNFFRIDKLKDFPPVFIRDFVYRVYKSIVEIKLSQLRVVLYRDALDVLHIVGRSAESIFRSATAPSTN